MSKNIVLLFHRELRFPDFSWVIISLLHPSILNNKKHFLNTIHNVLGSKNISNMTKASLNCL